MDNNRRLFREMKMNKKIGNEILFCEITHETLMQHFSLPEDFNSNRTRKREYVYARQIAMLLISKHTRFSLAKIGSEFGGRDHATVLHAKKTIQNLSDSSKKIKEEVNNLENLILYKMKVLSQKKTIDNKYYYVNFDDYTSIRFSDNKGIIITGFTEKEIFDMLSVLSEQPVDSRKHTKTGQYILEKTTDDFDTRDTASTDS
jgi:hypothetical protein